MIIQFAIPSVQSTETFRWKRLDTAPEKIEGPLVTMNENDYPNSISSHRYREYNLNDLMFKYGQTHYIKLPSKYTIE